MILKSLTKGIATIGVLVSATAILNTIVNWFQTPTTDWLLAWINAYKNLFMPMIDASFGRISHFFGYKLLDWGKHLIVLYVAFGASMVRTGQKEGPISSASDWLMFMLGWPLLLPIAWFILNPSPELIKKVQENPEKYVAFHGLHAGSNSPLNGTEIVKGFAQESGKIAILVVLALIANSSGVLK